MSDRVVKINNTIDSIDNVELIKPFENDELAVKGRISVFVEGLNKPLEFDVLIHPQYPFKSHDFETIKFSNSDLLEYNHIMGDGSICIHTANSPVLSQKLIYDFESVKAWIRKYYINKDSDTHYEHLIVPQKAFKGAYCSYFFNEVDYPFLINQYGFVDYSQISSGLFYTDKINSSIFQTFKGKDGKTLVEVKWNSQLKSLESSVGLFIFLENAPSKNNRWIVQKWEDLESLLTKDFLSFLHSVERAFQKRKNAHLPLFVGYKISDVEIHWQALMLEIGSFPIYPVKENQKWRTELEGESSINWAMTKNCSYGHFFGRGQLCEKITKGKILIIGIGAIGSILAKTLVRCGCTKIDFIDYDIKEPENVCRSEYSFATGINNKIDDLINELYLISPFFESTVSGYKLSEAFDFLLKSDETNKKNKSDIEEYLNKYDIIIDCSTDNDLLYVLSKLEITSMFWNFSISNHAKQLVCAVEKNRYDFIQNQFQNVLQFEIDDLYNPIGCWSPTFRASYNDINTLVQYALKHINLRCSDNKLRNFVLETEDKNGFHIKLNEF